MLEVGRRTMSERVHGELKDRGVSISAMTTANKRVSDEVQLEANAGLSRVSAHG